MRETERNAWDTAAGHPTDCPRIRARCPTTISARRGRSRFPARDRASVLPAASHSFELTASPGFGATWRRGRLKIGRADGPGKQSHRYHAKTSAGRRGYIQSERNLINAAFRLESRSECQKVGRGLQCRSSKRAKSRSVVTSSLPDSTASAARYASRTRSPRASPVRHSRVKGGQ